MKRLIAVAACALLATSCSQKPAAPASGVKFNTDLPMTEFMGHVVDPASFTYWKGSGDEETAKGDRKLAPTTDEGWENLESAAATLIEAGNMLQLPGRERHLAGHPDSDWYQHAQELTRRAVIAKAAAAKHDEAAVYKAGADLYEECTACHEEYVIQPQLKANGRPPSNPLPDWPADVKARQQAYTTKK